MRHPAFAAILSLACLGSCRRDDPSGPPGGGPRPEAPEAGSATESLLDDVGQVLYVPAYSSILTYDRGREFRLAVMLSVRNTDRDHPIVVRSVRYHGRDGRFLREFLESPARIGPLASLEFFVPESDTSGGVSASFLVDWGASRAVTEPVVEAIMSGTASNQGIAFTCPARVLNDRGRPDPTLDVEAP